MDREFDVELSRKLAAARSMRRKLAHNRNGRRCIDAVAPRPMIRPAVKRQVPIRVPPVGRKTRQYINTRKPFVYTLLLCASLSAFFHDTDDETLFLMYDKVQVYAQEVETRFER